MRSKMSMNMKSNIVVIIICLLIVMSVGTSCDSSEAMVADSDTQQEDKGVETESTKEIKPETVSQETASDAVEGAKEPVFTYNPLTNEMVETEELHRPIAFMLDNSGPARPQSAVAAADIVYEMPVEGGYSRLMAIYTNITDIEIGPIRSARPCFLDRAMEMTAIYVHCGGSDRAYTDIRNEEIEDIDQITAMKSVFWRSTHRKAPHNVYTTLDKISSYSDVSHYENSEIIPIFQFSDSEIVNESQENMVDLVDMWIFDNYTVQYKYNKENNNYERYVNDKTYKDEATDEAVCVSNIIFQSCETKRDDGSYDGNGRTIVFSNGQGNGYLLTGGGAQKITWSKKDRYSITEYFDEAGNPVELNTGKTWVHVLEQSDSVKFDGKAVLE